MTEMVQMCDQLTLSDGDGCGASGAAVGDGSPEDRQVRSVHEVWPL